MDELLAATALWLPLTLGSTLLVLLAPTSGTPVRTTVAAVLGLLAAAALVLGVAEAGDTMELEVINPFINPDEGKPIPFVVEKVIAPGWHWPVVAAVLLGVPALLLFVRRNRPPRTPCPVVFGGLVTAWTLTARLALEKAAAPEPLTWAVGVSMPMLVLLVFVGWWSGRERYTFKKLLLVLLLLALVQRALIIAVGFFATTQQLGTHLDVSAIREVTLPLGHKDFSGPGDHGVAQWVALILVPQLALWVPSTIVLGCILGAPGFVLGKRRAS